MNVSQFIHSTIDGHWGGFPLLTIMGSIAINILRYVFGKHVYTFLLGGVWIVMIVLHLFI